jgi:flagella basal body P-ring formation protein FlgA
LSLKLLITLVSLNISLFALSLNGHYKISGLDFNASAIDPSIKNDFILYQFEKNRHQKAFHSSKLVKRLEEHGYSVEDKSQGIVHIKRSASIDFGPIKQQIRDYYHQHYPDMRIEDIRFRQNSFIKELPSKYSLTFRKNAYHYHKSSLQITSKKDSSRHFLSYELTAFIKVFKARHNLNRGKILTQIDLSYKEVAFKRFNSLPLQSILDGKHRLKKRVVSGKVLYKSDLQKLPSVLKGKSVNVQLTSGQVRLEFQATALEDGHIGDEITIMKQDGKKLKAKVISINMVEIQ